MDIALERIALLPSCTLGRIIIGCETFYTIERPWINNTPWISCIPSGSYICKRYSSDKYRKTYEITNVPGRTHILFHSANYANEVAGCIALGTSLYYNAERGNLAYAITQGETCLGVRDSRTAVRRFLALVGNANEFNINITNLEARL